MPISMMPAGSSEITALFCGCVQERIATANVATLLL
ncbi:hypothetical protein Barb7_03279 [Bacteroidales bacterium Barb7]|nr:hypothetical protein Barb7_03279 [Bacteroidales bacterium Barb7]